LQPQQDLGVHDELDIWLGNKNCMPDFGGELLKITCKTKMMGEQY
jgi:hypothetical protein